MSSSLSSTIWAALTAAFAAFTVLDFFGAALGGPLKALLLLAVVALSAAGSGRFLVSRAGLPDLSDSQRTLLGFTLGLGLLSLGTFVLGLAGLLRPWAAAGLLGALWLVGFTELRAMAQSLAANRNLLLDRPVAATGLLVSLALLLWTCWAPPHQYDSLVYHLELPAAYVRAGRIVTLDWLLYSHFPQNGEMLFTLALLLKSDLLAQMLMWLSTALTVWWVFESGKREAPLAAVMLACGLLLTHTSVMALSGTTYVEPLVMLWVTAAVLSFYRWRGMSSGQPGQRTWLAFSAVFCGLALGVKYYAGITAGLLGLTLLVRLLREPGRGRAYELFMFTGITTVLFMPWLLKNAWHVGNPVFPFLYRFFPTTVSGWEGEAARGYFQVLTEYGHGGGALVALARLPLLLLSNSQRFGGGMDALGTLGWELSFWALPAGLWAARSNRFLRGLLVYLGGHMAVWFSTRVVLRFLVPVAPLLCLVAAAGLHAVWQRLGRGGRLLLGSGVAALTGMHLLLFFFIHGVFGTFAAASAVEDRETFLAKRLEYYPCARWASARLGQNDRIMLVGEQRAYYLETDHVATTVHAPNRFMSWAEEAAGPKEFAAKLASEGFTHLLLVPRELARLAPGLPPLSPKAEANLGKLDLERVYDGPACGVYALKR